MYTHCIVYVHVHLTIFLLFVQSITGSGTASSYSIGGSRLGGSEGEGGSEDDDYQLSELEILISTEEEVIQLYRQDSLISDIDQLVKDFDDNVLHLRHEKSILDAIMKLTELKYVNLYYMYFIVIHIHVIGY